MNYKIIYSFIILLLFSLTDYALAQQEKHLKAKIYTNDQGINALAELGLPVDHAEYKRNTYIIGDFSETELQVAAQSGFVYDVLCNDVSDFYQKRNLNANNTSFQKDVQASLTCVANIGNYSIPDNFQLGSMGGFFTYQEMLDHLDNMHELYGDLVSEKEPIAGFTTEDGNVIYRVKISDNPDIEESGEPQILFTALHHAREPASLSQLIFFMYYLLENYETDPNIAYLLQNTEIQLIPCLNPDGYRWNELTNPNGGGMWRKNRRDNDDDTYGVDLNRNYGYLWGYDDFGSSGNTNNGTYRGPEAFSEPETSAVKDFCESQNFQIALNYHSSGNLLIYPWGFVESYETPDSTLFRAFAKEMTKENNFVWGTGDQTVGYLTNGVSDDWMYGEQTTKNKIFSFTPEVGRRFDDGFWPTTQRIIPICQSNVWQNLTALRLLHNYALITETSPQYINAPTTSISFKLQRIGLEDDGTFTVSIQPLTDNIISVGEPLLFTGLEIEQSIESQIQLTLSDTIKQADAISFNLLLDNGQGLILEQNITKFYGQPVIAYTNDCTDINQWVSSIDTLWQITNEQFVSESSSITDSPNGNYQTASNCSITLNDTIDLADCVYAKLNFWAKWDIETYYDYVQLQAIDIESGTTTPLCGKYSRIGSPYQFEGEPIYEGVQSSWVLEEVDLSSFIGQKLKLRFLLASDGYVEFDGFYFDDIMVEKLSPLPEDTTTTISTPNLPDARGNTPILLPCVPNPVQSQTLVQYLLPLQDYQGYQLMVVNNLGQPVLTQSLPPISGLNSIMVNTQHWNNGLYYYYITNAHSKTSPRMMTVVK